MNHPTSNRNVPGLKWYDVPLEENDDTREEVMRKIEEAIEAVVEAVMRPPDADVQEAVSGAVAESIAAFALDNSVAGPGQVLRIRPVPERNSLEAGIGGAEMEVPVPLPIEADEVVRVDVAEAVAEAVGEEERRTKLTESVKEALASILESKNSKPDPTKFGISVTAEVEGESKLEGNGIRDELSVRFSDDLFSVPEFGFTVDTTTTTEENLASKGA